MIIGIPKEIKNNENRVALTPAGARELVKRGHKVYVQATAGVNSGFADDAYTAVGAEMLPSIEEVYARAEMIVKVKEPVAPEYKLIRRDQLVFTFFHFASSDPACSTIPSARLRSSRNPNSAPSTARCPEELTGRNSATPCTTARMTT